MSANGSWNTLLIEKLLICFIMLLQILMAVLIFGVGFTLKSMVLKRYRKRVLSLENEMLRNHAYILDLEREKSRLLNRIRQSKRQPEELQE